VAFAGNKTGIELDLINNNPLGTFKGSWSAGTATPYANSNPGIDGQALLDAGVAVKCTSGTNNGCIVIKTVAEGNTGKVSLYNDGGKCTVDVDGHLVVNADGGAGTLYALSVQNQNSEINGSTLMTIASANKNFKTAVVRAAQQ
jgi:hypothetical protein